MLYRVFFQFPAVHHNRAKKTKKIMILKKKKKIYLTDASRINKQTNYAQLMKMLFLENTFPEQAQLTVIQINPNNRKEMVLNR